MNRSFDRSILPMSYLGHLIIEDCLDLSAHGPAACLVHSLTRQKGGMTSSMLPPLPWHLEADSSMSHPLFVAPSGDPGPLLHSSHLRTGACIYLKLRWL